MKTPALIYFADPMCSWCWGFSPVFERLRREFAADFEFSLIMGGLYPSASAPLDESSKAAIRDHWDHVYEASAQRFDYRFFERDGFVYNTEPPCRAVVTAREFAPGSEFSMLERVHSAFYADNLDVTESATLADVAVAVGFERSEFLAHFDEEKARLATGNDFAITQSASIQGFPALIAGAQQGSGPLTAITIGFQPYDTIAELLRRWLEEARAAPAGR